MSILSLSVASSTSQVASGSLSSDPEFHLKLRTSEPQACLTSHSTRPRERGLSDGRRSLRSKSFKSPTVTQHLPHHPTKCVFISSSPLESSFSTSLNMVRSIVAVVSILSLLLSTHAATINVREGGCTYTCPSEDLKGRILTTSAVSGIAECCYSSTYCCTYSSVSGFLLLHCRAQLTPCLSPPENSPLAMTTNAPAMQPRAKARFEP